MPDHPAFAATFQVETFQASKSYSDAEELLMASDLAHPSIEDRETAHKVEKARRSAHRVDGAILFTDRPFPSRCQLLEKDARVGKVAGENSALFLCRQRSIDRSEDVRVLILFIAPDLPELARRAHGGITGFLPLHAHQELRIVEKLRDVVLVLIPDQLTIGFLERLRGALVLDHDERDAVHETDDIAAPRRGTGRPLHTHFRRHMEDVVLGCLPVDVLEGIAFAVAFNRLGDRRAQNQEIIDVLVRALQPLQLIRGRLETA